MGHSDRKALPAPLRARTFFRALPPALIFLAGLSRNATDFCYDDDRAGYWQSGAVEEALYTHTHTDTLVYSTPTYSHNSTHTQSPPCTYTHTHCTQATSYNFLTRTLCVCYTLHTHMHTHTHTLTLGHQHQGSPTVVVGARTPYQALWPLRQPRTPFPLMTSNSRTFIGIIIPIWMP